MHILWMLTNFEQAHSGNLTLLTLHLLQGQVVDMDRVLTPVFIYYYYHYYC